MAWDKTMKCFRRLGGLDNCYIAQTWIHSPVFIISERDSIDKRMEFLYNNRYYVYSSAVPNIVNTYSYFFVVSCS